MNVDERQQQQSMDQHRSSQAWAQPRGDCAGSGDDDVQADLCQLASLDRPEKL